MAMVELPARPGKPLGLTPAAFMRDFWQKKPLLVRGAFPKLAALMDRPALFATASRKGATARMVWRERPRGPLRLRHGPFSRGELARPPGTQWTLLVNDLEKHHPERFAEFLSAFRFLPVWRIDDLMASYAVPGGSVGAHVDQYDVFLVQGIGRREWRLDLRPQGWRPRPHSELRLVSGFRTTWQAVLKPGDLLYLPPGVPHHGIARSECLSFSLGMRAPALGELFGALADAFLERDPPLLLRDPDLAPRRHAGELREEDLERVAAALCAPLRGRENFAELLASFLSTWRGKPATAPRRARFDPVAALAAGQRLRRDPWLRALWWRRADGVRLAVGGRVFSATPRLAELVAGASGFGRDELPDPLPEERRLLRELAAHAILEVAPSGSGVR